MSKYIYSNNAASTMSGSLSQGGTTLILASGTGSDFPAPAAGESFLLTVFEKDESSNEVSIEVVECTSRTADTLTITRDVESMTGQAGGYAYPTVPARTVYCQIRWTAASANNALQETDNLASLASAATARTNLGLGSIATQAASSVAITGGSISGVTFDGLDSTTTFKDNGDASKQMKFEVSGVSTATTRTLTVPNADGTIALLSDLSAYQEADSDLAAVAGLATNGLVTRTATGAMTTRTITQPAAGITVTNGDGVAGAPTLALANDLAALEGLTGTGIPIRTATDTWSMAVSGTNIKTVGGQSLLGSGDIPAGGGITNVVTATTATTLTSTKTLLQITPASYGVRVTLPDATTCTEGGPLHIIDNKGAYPVLVQNTSGTLLGFIYGGVVSHVSLIDNATAAGVWSIENSELVGASAQLLTTVITGITVRGGGVIALDSNREIIIGTNGSALYGVVYDKSTNTFGTPTSIRAAGIGANDTVSVLAGADKVLVASSFADAFEAVILSIDGTTITVNTAATVTLSASLSAFADGCGLVAIPSVSDSFVTSYKAAAQELRAISVSGTEVTIGSATVLDGTAGGLIAATGDKVIAVSTATTHLYTKPYTVSGSTLSAGTGTDTNSGTQTLQKFFALGTRWCALYNDGGSTVNGGIVSLATTTTTITTATLFAAGTLQDAIIVGSNKVLVLNNQPTNNGNILTDTAGTASAGTAITVSDSTARVCLYASGTDVAIQEGTTNYRVQQIDCSGASPVLTKTIAGCANRLSNTEMPVFVASNSVLSRSANGVYGAAFAQTIAVIATGTENWSARVSSGRFSKQTQMYFPWEGSPAKTAYRGAANSERWLSDGSTVITKVECVA